MGWMAPEGWVDGTGQLGRPALVLAPITTPSTGAIHLSNPGRPTKLRSIRCHAPV